MPMSVRIRNYPPVRIGLRKSRPEKCFSLSVTITHPFASATAATIISSSLLGFPATRPSDMRRAQSNAAFSSNGKTRPLKSACGPSGPANHASKRSRFFPLGLSRMPRLISATVKEEMNNSPSACALIHSSSNSDGPGLVTLLIMLVSRRYRVKGQPSVRLPRSVSVRDRPLPAATEAMPQVFPLSSAVHPRWTG